MTNPHAEIYILDGNETKELLRAYSDKKFDATDPNTGFNAEARAMIQSLYSRSPKSVIAQLQSVMGKDAGNFMEKFYVNYGHKSIGDCGYITIFIEQVSMFVAKAIQDNRLYSGQEASTRYLDFSKQPIINPLGNTHGQMIQDLWMQFYKQKEEPLQVFLKQRYPIKAGEDVATYERAIKVRAFDILRGFLPCGTSTLLAWTTNLRQAADRMTVLRHHPMPEVREVAQKITDALKTRYPNSFSHKTYDTQEKYLDLTKSQYFFAPDFHPEFDMTSRIDNGNILQYKELFLQRPKYTELPSWLDELGQVEVNYLLDFGSYRDVQRHRAGIVRMPLVETRWGFHSWYLEQLPDAMRAEAESLIKEQNERIQALPCDIYEKQYYVCMGYNVPVKLVFGLPGLVYLAELRSGKTVHPSLRRVTLKVCDRLKKIVPYLQLHADTEPDDWDIRRGSQTILDTKTGKAISD